MPVIMGGVAHPWPTWAHEPTGRADAHAMMVLWAGYFQTLGLTRVRFAGDYDLEGDEGQIPQWASEAVVDQVSPKMRWDFAGGITDRPPISITVGVHLGRFYNPRSASGKNRYMPFLRVGIGSENPSPWVGSLPPGTMDGSSADYYTVAPSDLVAVDFASSNGNALLLLLSPLSIGSAAGNVNGQLGPARGALELYVERGPDSDLIILGSPDAVMPATTSSGADYPRTTDTWPVARWTHIFDSSGNIQNFSSSSEFSLALANYRPLVNGKFVVQRVTVPASGVNEFVSEKLFVAGPVGQDGSVVRLDFSGEERSYLVLPVRMFRPGPLPPGYGTVLLYELPGE